MKRFFVFTIGVVIFCTMLAFRVIDDKTTQLLKQLGITYTDAKDYIWSNINYAAYSVPSNEDIRKIAKGDRPAIVKQAAEFAKNYTSGEDFKQRYLEHREDMKPKPPEKPKSIEEQRKEQKAQLQQGLTQMEENSKTLSTQQQEQLKPVLEQLRAQLKAIDDPNNPMFSSQMEENSQQVYQAQMEEYNKKLEQWQHEWPDNPKPMVSRWLEKFLEVSSDVDYHAEVFIDSTGRTLFAKTLYEQKPSEWKLCYRAGKATVDAARKEAKQWLQELNPHK